MGRARGRGVGGSPLVLFHLVHCPTWNDRARSALAECKTVMEAKEIADVAEAARVYLERTNASAETVNRATEIRLLAERQMGEFLKAMPKADGGDAQRTRFQKGTESPPTLAEVGITKKQSATAQKLAAIPEDEFRARVAVTKASGEKLSTAAVLKEPAALRKAIHTKGISVFRDAVWRALRPVVAAAPAPQRGTRLLSAIPPMPPRGDRRATAIESRRPGRIARPSDPTRARWAWRFRICYGPTGTAAGGVESANGLEPGPLHWSFTRPIFSR
jgi:hypothetical protein